MREVHLITVGKLKDSHYESIEKDYLKRINAFKLSIHEVKTHAEDVDKEATEVLKKIQDNSKGSFKLITMMEKGKDYNSPDFSKWFFELLEDQAPIFFVIGGAAGHGEQVLEATTHKLSLGKLTYPHKLARVLLIEQLYRAQTISTGHPYHK